MTSSVDILILSNGPGEVTTWVRPVVKALREQLGHDISQVRISVILSPCPHASGKETAIALGYPEVDRVQAAADFWQFLLWGKTAENWDWRNQGAVVFLGGDQLFPVIIGKKLGYKTVVYAEWSARWHNFIDKFAIMKAQVAKNVSPKYIDKFTVVGDLMLEAAENEITSKIENPKSQINIIGILPGSKAAKLTQGVPLTLAIAEYIHSKLPQTKFFIPVAPTLDLSTLADFAKPENNPLAKAFNFQGADLIGDNLVTSTGLIVALKSENPAYHLLSQCSICLTTVGANTAELGALAVPMIVLLPTQQLDAMRSWDGLPGILANLPGVGSSFAKLINWWMIKNKGLLAWPNIWAQAEIVPELVGKLQPETVGKMVLDLLENPEKLAAIRDKLRSVRGEGGAAEKLAILVKKELL
ncbi:MULTISPECIES: lipid-A-disaccharide synthase [unclassified Dolichospermum]|jgi:lipid-A-disaccharide synthase|uniref:lipid-A-disaccharide synthase n=1 Tax=unclassified Dolichospermum TaxID=2622029 RepID=UPI00144643AF|nr:MULTISPECIES: lipid-A-disaccharide synthase [unclassified Dolichospermum]MBO1056506.1 lipid-A-disaccharide synthase [Dolichospermum sp. JUN01]MBS9389023.1 lipid-A-disaccharide synthase [Dolichospermum sp. WA123]MTJ16905.1 lipid-A-disaccharide synthase [Dolichospermum sp. UHCC 0299]MTJ23916.1 lipid-A-disaccharide synthase [Dolichospermum sp. UHCC 0352]MTJ41064.1 lipid-A-disaccharide synthase [Dolichospermum sp. UHCC 0406]